MYTLFPPNWPFGITVQASNFATNFLDKKFGFISVVVDHNGSGSDKEGPRPSAYN